MNNFKIKFILPFICFLFSLNSTAQDYSDDSQLWTHVKLKKEINKKIDMNLKLQGRFTNNITKIGRGSSKIGISYKINKNIKLSASYAYLEKSNRKGIYKTQHRYYLALTLKKDLKRFEFSYRNQFMCSYIKPFTRYEGYIAYLYDRNKITINYEATKRMLFYIAEEVNMPLNNPQLKGLSRSRSYAGLELKVRKHQKLELYFMYNIQLQQGDWFNQDISYANSPLKKYVVYGIGYNIDF